MEPNTSRVTPGDEVPNPTNPFSRIANTEVEALFTKLTSVLVPVPAPQTVSLDDGDVVPILTLPVL